MAFVLVMCVIGLFGLLAIAWMKYDDIHSTNPSD